MGIDLPRKVRDRQLVIGTFVRLPSLSVVQALLTVDACCLDFIVIDTQHQAINDETVSSMVALAAGNGVGSLVRIAPSCPWRAELMLDMGADGVIFPVVNSASDAKEAVARCRYPPAGVRSVGGLGRTAKGQREEEIDALCIVQVETIQAATAAAEIFATTGIDGLLMGPVDLARSMGIQLGYGKFSAARQAVEETAAAVESAAIAAGIAVMRHCTTEQDLRTAIDANCRLITVSTDVSMLQAAIRRWGEYVRAAIPAR